jgi:uncharacterized membrane protein HdeD (DUF308 family)
MVSLRSAGLARNWWAILLRGVIALAFGLFAFLTPDLTLGSLVFVAGIYLLVDGAFAIVAALRALSHHERWGLLILEGALGLVAGAAALALPALAIVVIVTVMAIWAVVTGGLLVMSAFGLHAGHGRWLLGLGGAVSVIWGLMLLVFPVAGAVVLTVWLGAYAVIFGISMIALGLRLRSRHRAVV